MLISTLRNIMLCNATSVRDIIIWYLSTAEMGFDVTSALILIALTTVWSRTLARVRPVFLAAALITQLELITALLKSLRLSVRVRHMLYDLFIIKSQFFTPPQTSLQYLKISVTFISFILKVFYLLTVNSLSL